MSSRLGLGQSAFSEFGFSGIGFSEIGFSEIWFSEFWFEPRCVGAGSVHTSHYERFTCVAVPPPGLRIYG